VSTAPDVTAPDVTAPDVTAPDVTDAVDDVPADQVTDLLVALSRARRWLSRLAADPVGNVGSTGVSALAQVVRSGPLRLGDLAAREKVAPATLSRVVAGLVEHGYVERTPDPEDARAGLLTATAAGRQLLEESRARRSAELAARLRRLDHEERAAVLRAAAPLQKLVGLTDPPSGISPREPNPPGRRPAAG
jgi:DNA-binding MarR family transcriptional regulator